MAEEQPVSTPQTNTGSGDEKLWAMLCHLSALAGYVIPFGNIIGPLIIWMMKKEEYALVDDQGKESLNFQISITIYVFISIVLIFLLVGIPLLILIALFALVMMIIAGIKAYDGEKYRYPLTIRIFT